MIEGYSALITDYNVPRQTGPKTVGDEIRVFCQYYENGNTRATRVPQYRNNGDGLIAILNKYRG